MFFQNKTCVQVNGILKKILSIFFQETAKISVFFWKTFRHLSYKEVKYKQSYVWGRTLKMTVRQWSSNCDAWINAHTLPIFRVFARWKVPNETLQNLPFSKQKIKFTFSVFHFLLLYKFSQMFVGSKWVKIGRGHYVCMKKFPKTLIFKSLWGVISCRQTKYTK